MVRTSLRRRSASYGRSATHVSLCDLTLCLLRPGGQTDGTSPARGEDHPHGNRCRPSLASARLSVVSAPGSPWPRVAPRPFPEIGAAVLTGLLSSVHGLPLPVEEAVADVLEGMKALDVHPDVPAYELLPRPAYGLSP